MLKNVGSWIKAEFKGKTLVAIPGQKFNEGHALIKHGEDFMQVVKKEALHEIDFEDKYGRGKKYTLYYGKKYTLYYYEWKPTGQTRLF